MGTYSPVWRKRASARMKDTEPRVCSLVVQGMSNEEHDAYAPPSSVPDRACKCGFHQCSKTGPCAPPPTPEPAEGEIKVGDWVTSEWTKGPRQIIEIEGELHWYLDCDNERVWDYAKSFRRVDPPQDAKPIPEADHE